MVRGADAEEHEAGYEDRRGARPPPRLAAAGARLLAAGSRLSGDRGDQ